MCPAIAVGYSFAGVGNEETGEVMAQKKTFVIALVVSTACLVLACLLGMAVSGSLLQTSLRNPLAAPDTLGITAGGELATVVALLGFGQLSPLALTPIAFVGSLLGAIVVLLAAGKSIFDPARLALTGVAVSVGLAAITQLLLVRVAPEAGAAMMTSIGVRSRALRLVALGVAIACGSAAVAAVAGAALVVATDAVGRWAFAPTEIPVGALIAIVGAPYFIYLVHRVTSVKRK